MLYDKGGDHSERVWQFSSLLSAGLVLLGVRD